MNAASQRKCFGILLFLASPPSLSACQGEMLTTRPTSDFFDEYTSGDNETHIVAMRRVQRFHEADALMDIIEG
jgi:hypothetical protein